MSGWSALVHHIVPISTHFRARRLKRFWQDFQLAESTRVLDVGGTSSMWRCSPRRPALAMLNIALPGDWSELSGVPWVIGDGRYLPFKDKAYDVVFSNSVIEHLGSMENQQLFASECRRVGVRYYVQTPYKYSPIEPHLLSPLIHWLPKSIQRRLLRNFTPWGWLRRPTEKQCDRYLGEIRLLTVGEMIRLFPDAEIQRERVLGLTKSLIAVKRRATNGDAAPALA